MIGRMPTGADDFLRLERLAQSKQSSGSDIIAGVLLIGLLAFASYQIGAYIARPFPVNIYYKKN